MDSNPKVSEAEWQVMNVLWEKSPQTVREIVEILSQRTDWQLETIRTLVNRLERKGAIGYEKRGRRYHYYPLLDQEQCVRQEAESILSRTGTAVLKPLLSAFIEQEDLSEAEIEELREILAKKEGDHHGSD